MRAEADVWDGGKAVGVIGVRVRRMGETDGRDGWASRIGRSLWGVGGCHEAGRPSAGTVAFGVRVDAVDAVYETLQICREGESSALTG